MKTLNLRRRLEVLEEQLTSEPILLLMPDAPVVLIERCASIRLKYH
jgi:hypothetical protein